MTTTTTRFGLTDAEFWTDPGKTTMDVADRLWERGRDVVELDGPSFVPIDQEQTLPVVVYRAASCEQLAALRFDTCAVVTAMDLERNRLYAGMVTDEEIDTEEPYGDDLEGAGMDSAVPDLRHLLHVPWQPGRFAVTVLLREMASNRTVITLGRSAGAYHDEAVEQFVQEQARVARPPEVFPAPAEASSQDSLPRYGPDSAMAAIPDEPGVVVGAPRITVDTEGVPCRLDGAFRVVPRPHERIGNPLKSAINPTRPVTAVVGITLVVTASDHNSLSLYRLDVPATDADAVEAPEESEVIGQFSIDLRAEGIVSGPQTYFIYAFCGEHMTGPTPAALVSEQALLARSGPVSH